MKPILFTSLAPRNLEHQLTCVASWRPHVSGIVSINHQAEADIFTGLPDWMGLFTYAGTVGDEQFHVPLHRFAEAIADLAQPTDPVVLCNSDIYVRKPPQPLEVYADTDGLRFLSRIDVDDTGSTHKVYDEGFDVFFFQARHHVLLPKEPFCLGQPWWDFFLPLNFLRLGFPVQRLQPSFAYHDIHPQNWDEVSFRVLGGAFMQALFPQFVQPNYRHREVLELCGMIRHLLISRDTGVSFTASDLQRLHRRLDAWPRRYDGRIKRSRMLGFKRDSARLHRESSQGNSRPKLHPGGRLIARLLGQDWHFRFRLSNGTIVSTPVRHKANNGKPHSVFIFGTYKGGSTLLHWLCSDALALNKRSDVNVPSALGKQGNYFFRVEQDVDGLYEWPGFCFTGFRALPLFLRNSATFGRSPKLLLVRDPRDILVSTYFSWTFSHLLPKNPQDREHWLELREQFSVQTIDEFVLQHAEPLKAQMTDYLWMLEHTENHRVIRYEDIIFAKDLLLDAFSERLDIHLSRPQRRKLLAKHDIRPRQENIHEHVRKVIPGDHREKLTAETIARLNEIFAPVHQAFGYGHDGVLQTGTAIGPSTHIAGHDPAWRLSEGLDCGMTTK